MSQPDLLTQLRESRPLAPAEVREHIRRIAAQSAEPRRQRPRITWRRSLALAIPVAAAVAAGVLLAGGGQPRATAPTDTTVYHAPAPPERTAAPADPVGAAGTNGTGTQGTGVFTTTASPTTPSSSLQPTLQTSSGASTADKAATIPATNPNRVQRVTAQLELRVPNSQAVSDATKQAVQITRGLGGFPSKLDVNAAGRTGYAELVLRIPKGNVQKAVTRLSTLGTIMGENVSIEDIQASVDATTRKLNRLFAERAAWQAQPQTAETQQHIAALTDQISKVRRSRTATIRNASYATVGLELTTKAAPAPLRHGRSHFHGLAVAFRWVGIGAVYGFALGAPVLLVLGLAWLATRGLRRRREDALLSRP
jgi:hypothetical protein